MSRISQTLLKRGEKIEASRSRGVIRITAPQKRAEVLISEIEKVVQHIKHDRIGLRELTSSTSAEEQNSLLDPVMHMWLGKLSETEINALSDTEVLIPKPFSSPSNLFSLVYLIFMILMVDNPTQLKLPSGCFSPRLTTQDVLMVESRVW